MGTGTLTIYSASAGSGKTHKLTGIYLTRLFRSKNSYRRILAVTFTNRATAEMKSRILEQLASLASGKDSDYLESIIKETGMTEERIRQYAGEILFSVLHDYSRFTVCTIDTFFQKILRAFVREAGLNSGFSIELDPDIILSSAVDEMIAGSPADQKLIGWLKAYTASNLDDDRSWNLKDGIMKLASELFRERFIILSENEKSKLDDKDFLSDYIGRIKLVTSSFQKRLIETGKKCKKFIQDYDLSDDMFYRRSQGIPSFIRNLAAGVIREPNSYVREIESDPPRWSKDKVPFQLQKALVNGLEKELKECIRFYDKNIISYNSAVAVLSNIYALGILSDILKKVHEITSAENNFLLSDAAHVLNKIIGEDQAPFIYEKAGNRYENFMIDEFQDTSEIQWNNFKPLINNSMSEGFDNLVVGDVKQSIYRWRNSNWKILGEMEKELVDNKRFFSEPLNTNWRSRSEIIRFNNSLFTAIPRLADKKFSGLNYPYDFTKLFAGAVQADPSNKPGGYVRIEFISDDGDGDDDGSGNRKNENLKRWNIKVLDRIPGIIELLQDKGYHASDIGILVRDRREGASVLKKMIEYADECSPEKRSKYNYNLVSGDSLVLSGSHAINFLIAVLTILNNPDDMIARAMMLRFYLLATGVKDAEKAPLDRDRLLIGSPDYFPSGYDKFLEGVRNMPLFEITERIIDFFGLGRYQWNVAYLNTFQDWVIHYTGSKNSGLQTFLEWWESTGKTKSVVLPGTLDAVRVLTVHKSKGLEFSSVILPFLSWNLDHKNTMQPFLWVNPKGLPFSELGIVPVKYSAGLTDTIFAEDYHEERFSVHLDNVNLLYVAMTRAKDAIFGFAPANPGRDSEIAQLIKDALTSDENKADNQGFLLNNYYNKENGIFETGEIITRETLKQANTGIPFSEYSVSFGAKSFNLKLHGENYFSATGRKSREKINYGKLMHEIFEKIKTEEDIMAVIRSLVSVGKISEQESAELEQRVISLVRMPQVSEWFQAGNKVLTEAEILLPSGILRRPDRVIIREGKTTIIDFKFGEENPHYIEQVRQYSKLLGEMGYSTVAGFIWYVDKNKVIPV